MRKTEFVLLRLILTAWRRTTQSWAAGRCSRSPPASWPVSSPSCCRRRWAEARWSVRLRSTTSSRRPYWSGSAWVQQRKPSCWHLYCLHITTPLPHALPSSPYKPKSLHVYTNKHLHILVYFLPFYCNLNICVYVLCVCSVKGLQITFNCATLCCKTTNKWTLTGSHYH